MSSLLFSALVYGCNANYSKTSFVIINIDSIIFSTGIMEAAKHRLEKKVDMVAAQKVGIWPAGVEPHQHTSTGQLTCVIYSRYITLKLLNPL